MKKQIIGRKSTTPVLVTIFGTCTTRATRWMEELSNTKQQLNKTAFADTGIIIHDVKSDDFLQHPGYDFGGSKGWI